MTDAGPIQAADSNGSAPRLLVVGGVMRGGTTLLRSMLSSHPRVTLFARELRALSWCGVSGAVHALAVHQHLWSSGRRIRDSQFRNQVYGYVWRLLRQNGIFGRVVGVGTVHRVFTACLANPSSRYVGDKYPDYIFHYPGFIHRADCRSIFIIRDPLDVVSSILHRIRHGGWLGKGWVRDYASIEGATAYWVDVATAMADLLRLDGNALVIRYEDLVLATRPTVEVIAEYLDLPVEGFDTEAPRAASIGKHTQTLNAQEIREIKQRAATLMASFGYA